MAGPACAVRLSAVTKTFGKHTAVDRLDLEIPRGSIYGLLGPNGSGKTTTIRMIMGILHPDRGRVELLDGDPYGIRRTRVCYLPEERGLYRKMKVLDVLVFLGELRGVPRVEGRRRAERWLERLGLLDWAEAKVEDLSKGMQQKIQFIGTVVHEPELLILDEPFSGLDPINQDILEEIVLEFRARGTTVLFSTHLMDQAERLCERVCLIARARKVLDGDLRELKRRERKGVVAVRHDGPDGWLEGPGVVRGERVGDSVHLLLRDDADPQAILRRGVEAGATIRRFELVEPRLHEIFVRHAGAEAVAHEGGLAPEAAATGGAR
ncbi:MAG TPA: ATP-binding cassette domain-containing protein [Longimicrobiales bacterium]|nr:ATP-binding cassette domain-containing protein [Longimicrobiales bacterium]